MTTQIDLLADRRDELAELCRKYGVRRLYLFGSGATGHFADHSSDLDFLVEMADREPTGSYADRYLGLASELETLFRRHVDLISDESVQNPYFRKVLEATRRLVYGQTSRTAAV